MMEWFSEGSVMSFTGTVVNGTVVLDGPTLPPEGSRVDVMLAEDWGVFLSPEETPEEQLAGLREAIEDVKAGRTRPFKEAMDEIRKCLDLPDVPEEDE